MKQKELFQKSWKIAKLFLALLLIFFVGSKTNVAQIKLVVEDVSWGWFSLHLLSFFLMTLMKAYQYHLLIGRKTHYRDILRIVIWQNAISNFISNSAGIASYMAMLRAEQQVKLTRSGTVFLITKFGDLLAICLYLGISAAMVWMRIELLRLITLFLILGMLAGLSVFLIVVLWRERFVTQVSGVVSFLRLDRFSLVARGMESLHTLAQEKQARIFQMLQVGVVMSFLYMTVTMVYSYSSIRMFDIRLEVWPLIYVAALMQIVSYVPIQVLGGLGVTEATYVYLFSFFGLDQGQMSAVMLGWRAVFYLANASILLYLPVSALLEKKANRLDHPG